MATWESIAGVAVNGEQHLLVINDVLEPAVELHAAYEAMKEEEKRREDEKIQA
ncbi:unnamed protein product [Nezara viridula]|uniref:Uncharacterized protein n=1 Tax=Nezara viridula TaxID=85310 RepID=A0A9P0DZE6_NEZVI|nr:unnamed protein product [Nezara viridula]